METIKFLVTAFQNVWPEQADSQADKHDYNYYRPQRSCEGYVFTPVCLSMGGGGVPGQVPLQAGTPPTPGQVHPPPPGRYPPVRYTPTQQMVTAVDGTHPTGMHSCYLSVYTAVRNSVLD